MCPLNGFLFDGDDFLPFLYKLVLEGSLAIILHPSLIEAILVLILEGVAAGLALLLHLLLVLLQPLLVLLDQRLEVRLTIRTGLSAL